MTYVWSNMLVIVTLLYSNNEHVVVEFIRAGNNSSIPYRYKPRSSSESRGWTYGLAHTSKGLPSREVSSLPNCGLSFKCTLGLSRPRLLA